ncbi:MAG: CPBP family intramembrane metalloprotease, partial [Phycisphaerae bacterium]|nr:CPBP family intramembrane metalloprotease [Phycisphaerae bacterium]
CFLLPLVAAYEFGSAYFLAGDQAGAARTIRAERLLSSCFEIFGVGGLYLPGLLLLVVLLIWHLLTRDRWRIRPAVPAWMTIESIFWTMPLLVIGQMVFRLFQSPPQLVAPALAGGTDSALGSLSTPARATIAVGAGLYEELLFRLVGIALVHAVAADLLRIKDGPAKAIAIFISAAAFAFYHDVMMPTGGIDPARLAIFTLAGLYFGTIFVLRGFGIVVAVHALYDLAVLVLLPR